MPDSFSSERSRGVMDKKRLNRLLSICCSLFTAVVIYVITSITDVKKTRYLFHLQLDQHQLFLLFSSFVYPVYQHTILLHFLPDHNLKNIKNCDPKIEIFKAYSNKNNNPDMHYKPLQVFGSFDFV
jgi:hypothetical protein